MNDVNKNLGHATAYGYAKSKGYTGTEEEFAELMADYAEVGERAEQAATAAAASATAAEGSASRSAASATAAEGFAGTAQTAAGNASQAASQASQAATQAAGSATAADTAKTAAQAAQTAAEDAAEDAETAAASVAGKTAQIDQNTEDISLLKSDLEAMSTASASDEGKALIAKTVTDGKVVEWEFGETGGSGSPEIVCNASGAVASFADGADGYAVKKLSVALEPVQDLHGQSNPYPGGGGKNLLDTRLETVKSLQTRGSWNNNVFTDNGGTFTVGDDGSITVNGTFTNTTYMELGSFTVGDSAVKLNGYQGTFNSNCNLTGIISSTWYTANTADGREIPAGTTVRVVVYLASGTTVSNYVFKPMIRLASVTDSTFAPYSNICPISGRQSVTAWRTGVNLWDEVWELGTISSSTGENTNSTSSIRSKNYMSCIAGAEYRYVNLTGGTINLRYYDASKRFLGVGSSSAGSVFTAPENAAFIRFFINSSYDATYKNNISINYPSTDHDYHAYDGTSVTVQLGQTVYGGTVDVVSGEMVVDRVARTFDGTGDRYTFLSSGRVNIEFDSPVYYKLAGQKFEISNLYPGVVQYTSNALFNNNSVSYTTAFDLSSSNNMVRMKDPRFTDIDTAKAILAETPLVIVMKLAEPLTVQLVGQTLSTLKGTNNIWSDAGDVSVDYVADTKLFIEQLTEPDADMVADANITSGKYFMVGNSLYLATANIASGGIISPGVNCTRTSLAAALNAINS